MADSDNTTTLSLVTRRSLLGGTAIAIAGWQPTAFRRDDLKVGQSADPAVAAWRKWQAAQQKTEQLCRLQQSMESKLVATVELPCSTIRLHDRDGVTLHSVEAEALPNPSPKEVANRAKAETDLAAHQARWDAADREMGYSAMLLAEGEAADRAEELLELLSRTPAASLAGVAAKLDAALTEGEPSEGSSEFPWPQIRSARDDLVRIAKEAMPEQVFPEEIGQQQHCRRPGEGGFAFARGDDGTEA